MRRSIHVSRELIETQGHFGKLNLAVAVLIGLSRIGYRRTVVPVVQMAVLVGIGSEGVLLELVQAPDEVIQAFETIANA